MLNIEKIVDKLKPVLEDLESKNNISTKISVDKDADIIRIYGEESDHIKRASSGLAEMLELAYTTAEHHPYWAILYHAAEISKMTLEKWHDELVTDQLSEMSWRCDEIKMALDRLGKK